MSTTAPTFKPVRYMGTTITPTSGLRERGAVYDTGWIATCPVCGWDMWGLYASHVRSSVRDHCGSLWCAERAGS